MNRRALFAVLAVIAVGAAGCNGQTQSPPTMQHPVDTTHVPPTTVTDVPGHDSVTVDSTHKESPRLVPAEAYMRTYLQLFGGLTELGVQKEFAGNANNGLFDAWNQYLGALGLPRYQTDFPRGTQTNSLMVAAFERLGIALCDRALEKDRANPSVDKRLIYRFDMSKDPLDLAGFTTRFDVLHQTFLGYPLALAPTDRTNRFFKVYQDVVAKQPMTGMKLTAAEAGMASMCYALIRHPEFHLY